ncbi:cyclic nucleotide-binding domain-containing protein [Breznakiella homolactica]|uniref:Cyclic nucleotide-binding domain-containing protein n=1 Tax=Breznakiella homolactica TaxID=2798577 RepID=A0A7T8BAB2_9SPIR|nr:cyclic nucleotide-binding domain-containing protein [Breznakiella homolactica]QQO10489.1 cyclic nucleotide-binding domain-containing protein [Breznakiella homolactica]
MPKSLQYRSGSVIYFQGDTAELVYILQSGKVNLTYQDIETGQDVHDLVQPGEFFGVKSALGRYPREENAIALQDTAVVGFTSPEFEQMAMANTRIIMKMLKVFSNQMRRLHRQVSSLMEKEEENPEMGLFNVGEYYLKNKRFSQAKYVFGRYLTYYPSGRNAAQAAKNLEIAEMSLSKQGQPRGTGSMSPGTQTSSAAGGSGSSGSNMTETARAYYDAVSLISQEKYQQAYFAFKKIEDANEEPEYVAKSVYEIGRCLYLLGKYDDCIKHFTQMITKYPKHPDLGDALFFMGQSYEKKGRKDQAATFYKKILSMPGDRDTGAHMKANRALKALEA